jgi:two-component system phosphate regulon sensor histidine kinase PhoR
MKEDIWRFTGVILFSLFTGLITQQVVICLLAGVFLFLIWNYRVLRQLHLWLQRRSGSNPPELPGIIDEICREIDFLRERHKQRKDKLAGFLRLFQDATASLPDAVIILGDFGVIEWANDKAEDYLGVCWPQDRSQRIFNLIRNPELYKFMNGEQGRSGNWLHLESPVDSSQILEIRIVPYGDDHKLLVARDITSIYRNNQMRKDFIANASHELRTPLTVISGYLEGLDDGSNLLPSEVSKQIRQMRRQTGRMQRLIDDLLTLSELETASQYTEGETVWVPDLISSIYQEAQELSGLMGHMFYLETDPDLCVCGSQRELYSAFSNLVFNAVQHTPEHGIIKIRWYADADGAHFEVTDNGEGIAPEHISRITERFYRVDRGRSREKGGTGLGLAIVKHVLAHHGGKLQITSHVGKGSIFRCDLPDRIIIYKNQPIDSSRSA